MADISYKIHVAEGRNDESPRVLYTFKDESVTLREIYDRYKAIFPNKGIAIERGFAGYPDEDG